jgi:pimeloyl-ACP methyl ester carboxylesterase
MKKRLPIFSTMDGYQVYLAAYEAMFDLWPVPHEPIDVQTTYGLTHLNACGPSGGQPLVLLHAAGFSSTAWFANVAALSAGFRLYAVDVIGDAGRSVANRVMDKRSDYAGWLSEVLDGLGIDRAHLLGHSYGGWLTINMALAHPERLHKIVLLAPAASLRPFSLLAQLGLRLAELHIRPPAKSTLQVSAYRGAVLEETFVHHMEMVSRHCVPSTMFPTVYTDKELGQVSAPTLLLIGDGERIYRPSSAIARAARLMPQLTAEIVPQAGHLLTMEQPEIVNARVLRFLVSDQRFERDSEEAPSP